MGAGERVAQPVGVPIDGKAQIGETKALSQSREVNL